MILSISINLLPMKDEMKFVLYNAILGIPFSAYSRVAVPDVIIA